MVGQLDPEELKRQFMLAVGLAEAGNVPSAIEHFRLAQRLDPKSPFAMNALAWLLATQPEPEEGDLSEALQLAQTAAKLTRFNHPQLLDTLAAALAAAGHFDKAVAVAQRAISIAQRAGKQELVEEIEQRLHQYQRREPHVLHGTELHGAEAEQ